METTQFCLIFLGTTNALVCLLVWAIMSTNPPSTLSTLSFSPSSRAALLIRCHASLLDPQSVLPRSGPWAHHILCPKKSLPPCLGRWTGTVILYESAEIFIIEFLFRTQHKDVWHINEKDRRSSSSSQMSRPEWENWHARHSIRDRITSSGSWNFSSPPFTLPILLSLGLCLSLSSYHYNFPNPPSFYFLKMQGRLGMACTNPAHEGQHIPSTDQKLFWEPLFPIIKSFQCSFFGYSWERNAVEAAPDRTMVALSAVWATMLNLWSSGGSWSIFIWSLCLKNML